MAAFNRLTEATYEIHESVKVDTQDNEDHTFCGIMFPVKCKDLLPIDHISIRSVAVRGQLGPMTVWVSKEQPRRENTTATASSSTTAVVTATAGGSATRTGQRHHSNTNNHNGTTVFRLSKSHWHKVYEAEHDPSPDTYTTLELNDPIKIRPGQVRAIYIHSTLPGDQAIVYDNTNAAFYYPHHAWGRGRHHNHNRNNNNNNQVPPPPRYQDAMISIHTGRAHVSDSIFGQMPIWGWGTAWRDHREFVGQLHYGAVYQLWNPEPVIMHQFGPQFKQAFFSLKLCQTRLGESPMAKLPDECIYYILNMCRWDWFHDTQVTMEGQRRKQKQRKRQKLLAAQAQQSQQQQQQQPAAVTTLTATAVGNAKAATSCSSSSGGGGNESNHCCCPRAATSTTNSSSNNSRNGNNNNNNHHHHHGQKSDDDEDSDDEYVDALEEQLDIEQEFLEDMVDEGEDEEEEMVDDDYDEDAEDDEEEDQDSDDDDDDDDDDDEENEWDHDEYRPPDFFRFVDPDQDSLTGDDNGNGSDDDDDDDHDDDSGDGGHSYFLNQFRAQFQRIHVLRALARQQDEGEEVVDMAF